MYDPDPISSQLLAYALDQADVANVIAESWEDCLAKAADADLRLVVLHSDDPLPSLLATLQNLYRAMGYPAPVFLTTHDHSEDRTEVLTNTAAVRVIPKPYDIRQLITSVKDRFLEEVEENHLYREIEQKEKLLTDSLKFQQRAVLMEEVNREILYQTTMGPKSTGEVNVFALDRELRYLYFTPDHAAAMERLFGRPPELGIKVTDFPWPPQFDQLIQSLGRCFEGTEVETDIHFVFDMVKLHIRARSRPLQLENGSVFGALVGLHNSFAEDPQAKALTIEVSPNFQPEWASLILRNLSDVNIVCDRDLRVLYVAPNRQKLPPTDYFEGRPLTDFLKNPSDWPDWRELKSRRLRWNLPGLGTTPLRVSISRIGASLRHLAEYLVTIHVRPPTNMAKLEGLRALWHQSFLPAEVFDSQGKLLTVNKAWKKMFPPPTESPKAHALSWPPPRGGSPKKLQHRGRSFRVYFFPHEDWDSTLALFIPKDPAHKSQWLQGPEIVSLIAHQWRQPLANLGALFNVLELRASQLPEPHQEFLPKIAYAQKLIQHLSSTIDDFRQYLSPQRTHLPTDLVNLCQAVHGLFSERLTALNVEWIWEIRQQPLWAPLYRGLVFQALIELTRNCLVAMESISRPKQLLWTLMQNQDEVVIEIRHTGRPFPPSIIRALQKEKKLMHTGQGLQFIRKVVHKIHGGVYAVEQNDQYILQKICFRGVNP